MDNSVTECIILMTVIGGLSLALLSLFQKIVSQVYVITKCAMLQVCLRYVIRLEQRRIELLSLP